MQVDEGQQSLLDRIVRVITVLVGNQLQSRTVPVDEGLKGLGIHEPCDTGKAVSDRCDLSDSHRSDEGFPRILIVFRYVSKTCDQKEGEASAGFTRVAAWGRLELLFERVW